MVILDPPATRYRGFTEGLIFRILYLGVDPGSTLGVSNKIRQIAQDKSGINVYL